MKVIRWPYGGNKEQGELGRSVLHGLLYGNYIGIATDVNDHPTFFWRLILSKRTQVNSMELCFLYRAIHKSLDSVKNLGLHWFPIDPGKA